MRRPTGSGNLNQRITIVDRDYVINEVDGGKVFDDSLIKAKNVWCEVKYIGTPSAGASEDRTEDQRTGKVKIEAKMRFRDDIEHTDAIVYMGGIFDIYSIQERGRDEFIVIRGESRDDDTYRIAISDAQSEEFYLNNSLGYVAIPDDDSLGDINDPEGALIELSGNPKYLTLLLSEPESFDYRPSEMQYQLEIPLSWFNEHSKSGRENDPLRRTVTPASSDVDLDVDSYLDPTDYVVYETSGEINELSNENWDFIFPYRGSSSAGRTHHYQVSINDLSYKTGVSSIAFGTLGDVFFPSEANKQSSFVNEDDKKMMRQYYKRSYNTASEDSDNVSYYSVGVALNPFATVDSEKSINLSHFGNGSGLLKTRSGTRLGAYTLDVLSKRIPMVREFSLPFVDLSYANLIRYYLGSVEVYDSLNDDFTVNFENPTIGNTEYAFMDYWDVSMAESNTKLVISHRYSSLGFGLGVAYGDSLTAYPVNIHHPSVFYRLDESSSRAAFYNHYANELGETPDGFDFRPALDLLVQIDDTTNTYYYPNVAIEELDMRVKNVVVKVDKLAFPEGQDPADYDIEENGIPYEEVSRNVSAYELDASAEISQSTLTNNHNGHYYAFDLSSFDVVNDRQSSCIVEFDVEYDIKQYVGPNELVLVCSNDANIESIVLQEDDENYDFDQSTSAYDWNYNETLLPIKVRAMKYSQIFPYTVTHRVRIPLNNG